ncbi:MAG: tetratricopeptide repeat protein [Synechococcales cyanobacterium RU_4_20]|nr:tetratricopeptide repeat protein [Synechococcales cyanobacterium RU_4_20]
MDGAVQEAIDWGLLTPVDAENPNLLTIQPVFPYFLKTKLAAQDEAFQQALRLGFKNHYEGLAGSYNQLMGSKEPQQRQMGILFCKLEYENLYNALQIALERQESPGIFLKLDFYHRVQNDTNNRLPLAQSVCEVLRNYPITLKSGSVGAEIVMAFDRLSECYLNLQKYENARVAYSQTLTTLDELRDIDNQWKQIAKASTYHQLGTVAQELREFEQARTDYQQALQIKIEFGDRYSQASTYGQLGLLAKAEGQSEEAMQQLFQALTIFREFQDNHSLAMVLVYLSRLYQANPSPQLPTQISTLLGISEPEVMQLLTHVSQE